MKKITLYSVACLIGSILICSCESNLSITKRHYNSGYYVDFNKNKTLPVAKEQSPSAQSKQLNVVSSGNTDKAVLVSNNTKETQISNTLSVATPAANIINKAIKVKHNLVSKPVSVIVSNEKGQLGINEQKGSEQITMDAAQKMTSEHSDGAALSLLWLVIVIILIIWLIGILAGGFGLGGLINLLLIIALILLILWLLRVI